MLVLLRHIFVLCSFEFYLFIIFLLLFYCLSFVFLCYFQNTAQPFLYCFLDDSSFVRTLYFSFSSVSVSVSSKSFFLLQYSLFIDRQTTLSSKSKFEKKKNSSQYQRKATSKFTFKKSLASIQQTLSISESLV